MVVTPPPPLRGGPDLPPEDGVIDDARDRQRRHRRYGTALVAAAIASASLIVGLPGGGGGSGTSQHARDRARNAAPGTHASSRSSPSAAPLPGGVGWFGLLAPRVGWVGNSLRNSLHLTRNGGRTWMHPKHVEPPNAMGWSSSPGPHELALSFAEGGQNALVIPRGVSAPRWIAQHVSGNVAITTDTGRTWSSHAFVPQVSPGALSFVNGRLGFILGYAAAAHHAARASLYETRDGARSWTRIGRVPFTGMLSFANSRDGLGGGWSLGAGLVDSAAIYRTANGGRSWTRTPLCRQRGSACEAPRLFASGRGVVLATAGTGVSGAPSAVEVYTTRDNGASWRRHVLPDIPPLTGDQSYIPFSAPDARDLFAWVSPYLYASHDAGRSWSRYREPELAPAGLGSAFSDIAFAGGSYGWYADGGVFAYTTDGGRHWTLFNRAG